MSLMNMCKLCDILINMSFILTIGLNSFHMSGYDKKASINKIEKNQQRTRFYN